MLRINTSNKINFKKGFTLIELMVTISIIAIVFGGIITSMNIIQKRGRDAQRQADLRNIQSALQNYYADHQFYPRQGEYTNAQSIKSRDNTKTYLNTIPKDPLTQVKYNYRSYRNISDSNPCEAESDRCHYYILCAKLESGANESQNCRSFYGPTDNFYEINPI